MGGPAEALNMSDPVNSANAIMRDGPTWAARQRRFNVDGPAEALIMSGPTEALT